MENTKLNELMKDEEFLKKILPLETPEEVQKAFEVEGVQITLEEVKVLGEMINKSIEKGGKPLTEEELESISGGMIESYKNALREEFITGLIRESGGQLSREEAENLYYEKGGDEVLYTILQERQKNFTNNLILGTFIGGGLLLSGLALGYGVRWGIKKIKSRKKK